MSLPYQFFKVYFFSELTVEAVTIDLYSCGVENGEQFCSGFLSIWEKRYGSGKRGRLPWHQFGTLLLWTDLANMRNSFSVSLGLQVQGGSFKREHDMLRAK